MNSSNTPFPRMIVSGAILRGSAMSKIVADFRSLVEGRTIKAAGYYHEEEGADPIPCLELDNDTIILTSADDEGNGPGVLTAYSNETHAGLCETEVNYQP